MEYTVHPEPIDPQLLRTIRIVPEERDQTWRLVVVLVDHCYCIHCHPVSSWIVPSLDLSTWNHEETPVRQAY
jgi:hypothetical protein